MNNETDNSGKSGSNDSGSNNTGSGDGSSEEVASTDTGMEDTVVLDNDAMDNVGDLSVEINVDELVAKIEADDDEESREKLEARRKLDALSEKRKAEEELDDTYNINLDDV